MSNHINEQLLEEASFYIDYWQGTSLGAMIEHAVTSNDLERVYELVQEARHEVFLQEYNPQEAYREDIY